MSTDSVSTGSTLRQFGLYRTIDARTEEFLRLSKKKQIRQGCVCAAVSTAITVTVVVIILLIYEYAIAVEWSVAHRKTRGSRNNEPYAERLQQNDFGFDQDYYEQMPLLLNSLQENNYVDPSLDIIPTRRTEQTKITTSTSAPAYKYNLIRRTSPRPFFFEYRNPTPSPFSKTYASKGWVERYRNTERLQNIRKVIKYLEKTINAKMGDMYTKPPSNSIAFTGLYVEPMVAKGKVDKEAEIDLILDGSDKAHAFIKNNNVADPLFNYKPKSAGEVNMLADAFLRFSPFSTISSYDEITTNMPIYKPTNYKRCFGKHCNPNINSIAEVINAKTNSNTYTDAPLKNAKSFSVMLNLFPVKTTTPRFKRLESTNRFQSNLDDIYFTTSKPNVQFRRKAMYPVRRHTFKKRPRLLYLNKLFNKTKVENNNNKTKNIETNTTKMIVHVNVYTPESKMGLNNTKNVTTLQPSEISTKKHYYTTEAYLDPDQVEDYHVGSSGVLPVTTGLDAPFIPIIPLATLPPVLEPNDSPAEEHSWPTKPPDVIKFGTEDAKVPEQYLNIKKLSNTDSLENKVRKIRHNFEEEGETLIIKLKNVITTEDTKTEITTTDTTTTEVKEELTTANTYVPQLNGHYRNMNQNLDVIKSVANSVSGRKVKFQSISTNFSKNYVEIKRNNTKTLHEDDVD